jgi:beta-lactamase class A
MLRYLLITVLGMTIPFHSPLSSTDKASTRNEIERLINASGAEVVGVSFFDTQTSWAIELSENVSMHAASTMKVPVMMEVFKEVAAGTLKLSDPIKVENRFHSLIDGSEFSLLKDDDSDAEVYARIGQPMAISDLIEHMITRSSNLATNVLIEKVKPERVNQLMSSLGASGMQVRRALDDTKAFRAGINNTTTSNGLLVLLRAIAEKRFLTSDACEQMISIMARQHYNDGIPAGLPPGTRVAHKTGWITGINHDAAIVYLPERKPYVLVVLTRGIEDPKKANRLIAEISRTIYRQLTTT